MLGEDAGPATLIKKDRGVRFLLSFHAGRAGRHAGNRESARVWPFLEQTLDFTRVNVAFNNVSLDYCSVASAQFFGHAQTPAMEARIFDIDRLHTEAVCPQMRDPRAAAASVGTLVDLYRLLSIGVHANGDQDDAVQNGFQ